MAVVADPRLVPDLGEGWSPNYARWEGQQSDGVDLVLGGGHRAWGAQTLAALTPVRHLLTDENRRVLDAFTALHHGEMADRLVAMARGGFRRQGPVSQAALWLAATLGRL